MDELTLKQQTLTVSIPATSVELVDNHIVAGLNVSAPVSVVKKQLDYDKLG